jgi:predicted metal-dependent hydrolase
MPELYLEGYKIKYTVNYRKVKYARLEFKQDILSIVVPKKIKDIGQILSRHKRWILKNYKILDAALNDSESNNVLPKSVDEFHSYVRNRISEYCQYLNVNVKKISLKKMVSRLGSMSARGNVSINLYLRYFPEILIDYVVFHEIAHLRVRNHNKKFYNIIKEKYSNYKEHEKSLYKHWVILQSKFLNI